MKVEDEIDALIWKYEDSLKKYRELRDDALIKANSWKDVKDDKMQTSNPYFDNMFIAGECETSISMIKGFLSELKVIRSHAGQ